MLDTGCLQAWAVPSTSGGCWVTPVCPAMQSLQRRLTRLLSCALEYSLLPFSCPQVRHWKTIAHQGVFAFLPHDDNLYCIVVVYIYCG